MIIIGGDKEPIERVKLVSDTLGIEFSETNYYAVAAIAATVTDAVGRIEDVIKWPDVMTVPEDATGWYIYGATFDEEALAVNYQDRTVTLLNKIGDTDVNFVVENADGSQIPVTWHIEIKDYLRALTVQINPIGPVTVMQGNPLTLTAQADGGDAPYSYRWYKNGRLIAGKNSATFAIPATDWADEGSYSAQATDANGTIADSSATVVNLAAQPMVI